MHFSQALLAFVAVAAAGVLPVPRGTFELEERRNGLTARDAIELQANVEIASASDEEVPELEPRTTAATILVKDDIEDLEVRQSKGGKKGVNSVIVVVRDAEPTSVPVSEEADGEELEARQAKAVAGVVSGLKSGGKAPAPKAPAAVRDVEPLQTPAPVLERDAAEEDDAEELEARATVAAGGKPKSVQAGGSPKSAQAGGAPKSAVVKEVDAQPTPAPVMEREAEEEDDTEELEARATVAAGGGKPKSAQAGGSPKSAQAGGAPKSAVVKEVDAQPTPVPELDERDAGEQDDAEELEARATVAAGGSKPKSAQAGGSPKSAQAGGQPKSAVVKEVNAQPTPAPELDAREAEEEDDAEELEARATVAAGGAGKPKASPGSGATKGKPSAVVAGRAECTAAQIVKREFQTVYVPVTRVIVERQPRETVYVV